MVTKLDILHRQKSEPGPELKVKPVANIPQVIPTKPENNDKFETKPEEEIRIREKFLYYIYPENNWKNADWKKK